MMPVAMHRVVLEVAEGVVHPPHVPLVGEPQPSMVDRVGDLGPRRALLGDHHRRGDLLADDRGELLQESDGVEVLAPTVSVGHPSPGRSRVVEVQHAGHGIDSQPVDVELVEPVEGIGDEEVAHLVASIVED